MFVRFVQTFGRISVPDGCLVTLFFQVKLRPARSRFFGAFSSKTPKAIGRFLSRLQSDPAPEAADGETGAIATVCLPELQSVSKSDVEHWATVTAPGVYADVDPETLRLEATRPFETAPSKPYETIIQALRSALMSAVR